VAGAILREPWATLVAEDFIQRMRLNTTNPDRDLDGRGSTMRTLVPPAGIEPATHGLGMIEIPVTDRVTCGFRSRFVPGSGTTVRCPASSHHEPHHDR
jgi:hypothetical protein